MGAARKQVRLRAACWNDALFLISGMNAKLFENPPIVLFGVDESFNAYTSAAWSVGDEIFFEFADSPNANSRMFSTRPAFSAR